MTPQNNLNYSFSNVTCVLLKHLKATNTLGTLPLSNSAIINGTLGATLVNIYSADQATIAGSLANVNGVRYHIDAVEMTGNGAQCEFHLELQTYTNIVKNRYFVDVGNTNVGCVDRTDNVVATAGFNQIDNGASAALFKINIVQDPVSAPQICQYAFHLEFLTAAPVVPNAQG